MEISFPSTPFESGTKLIFTSSPLLSLPRYGTMDSFASKNGKEGRGDFSFATSILKHTFVKDSPSLVFKCLWEVPMNFPIINDAIVSNIKRQK